MVNPGVSRLAILKPQINEAGKYFKKRKDDSLVKNN